MTTWNPSDCSSQITLSNGNLSFAANSSASAAVRSTTSKSTGKWYFEVQWTNLGAGSGAAGVANGTTALSSISASGAGAAEVVAGGTIYVNGSNVGSAGAAFAANDYACFALDLDNSSFWVRKNNGNWNNSGTANPATNTGGLSISGLFSGGATPAFATAAIGATPTAGTINFGTTSFAYAVPSNFSRWDALTTPTSAQVTQVALEQFVVPNPLAQVTQVALEQWGLTSSISSQAIVTQVALEEWAQTAMGQIYNLTGNLGGASDYG